MLRIFGFGETAWHRGTAFSRIFNADTVIGTASTSIVAELSMGAEVLGACCTPSDFMQSLPATFHGRSTASAAESCRKQATRRLWAWNLEKAVVWALLGLKLRLQLALALPQAT